MKTRELITKVLEAWDANDHRAFHAYFTRLSDLVKEAAKEVAEKAAGDICHGKEVG